MIVAVLLMVLKIVSLCAGTVPQFQYYSIQGDWRSVDFRQGIELFKKMTPMGFEPRKDIGNVDNYLCRLNHRGEGCANTGRLYFKENGDLVCDLSIAGKNYRLKITEKDANLYWVLVTPPECLTWIPIANGETVENLPKKRIGKTGWSKFTSGKYRGRNCVTRPICRVWIEEKNALLPGWWNEESRKNVCYVGLDGKYIAYNKNAEILAYNDLADVLPQCNVTRYGDTKKP